MHANETGARFPPGSGWIGVTGTNVGENRNATRQRGSSLYSIRWAQVGWLACIFCKVSANYSRLQLFEFEGLVAAGAFGLEVLYEEVEIGGVEDLLPQVVDDKVARDGEKVTAEVLYDGELCAALPYF